MLPPPGIQNWARQAQELVNLQRKMIKALEDENKQLKENISIYLKRIELYKRQVKILENYHKNLPKLGSF